MAPSSKKRKMSPPEKTIYTYDVDICSESPEHYTTNFDDSVTAVESILNYKFNDRSLLEEALTHSSFTDSPSYQRLEFLGDSVIQLAISNFVYLTYPDLDPGQLSVLRADNVSTERLARVALRHGLQNYVRHNDLLLNEMVREFVDVVDKEEKMVLHGGEMKAPKVLADIVEAVAAAVYVDCGFNLQRLWMVIREILEPIVMLKDIEKQPHPITMLNELCQKDGKHVEIKHWRKGKRNIASAYVAGKLIASGSSENKKNAKLHAAEAAVSKITSTRSIARDATTGLQVQTFGDFSKLTEIESAKQKVHELCNKKKWPKPIYRVEQEVGPAHDKKYVSSVQVGNFFEKGEEKSRVKEAENSAASMMYYALQESGHI